MAKEKRLIDANAALEKVCENCNCDFEECKRTGFCVDYENINQLPTVYAVEVVHGRWMHKGAWHIECSECHHILAHIGEAKNYCPNCGAKMDGDGNVV